MAPQGALNDLATAAIAAGSAPLPTATRCSTCRLRKVKCTGAPAPCQNCRRLGLSCSFSTQSNENSANSLQLVSPTEILTEAGTSRRRTTQACYGCRSQKVKCSGRRPQCHRCVERGLNCSYRPNRRHLHTAQSGTNSPMVSASSPDSPLPESSTTFDSDIMMSTSPLDTASQQRFLRRDVLAQHLEAYFLYIYYLPGYDFFHRPTLLEDLHHDRIPPVLCTAICAAVAMYVSRSKERKTLEVQWAKDVDAYLFYNLNKLDLLNLQVMILSMFQHFVYRQFGRVWLMAGMATKLALAIQLNKARTPSYERLSATSRECVRRMAWSLFLRDKLNSGGVEELIALPERYMHIQLPLREDDFRDERERQTLSLMEGLRMPPAYELGINGYLVILMSLRHDLLRETKIAIAMDDTASAAEVEAAISPLLEIKERIESFHKNLPTHFALSNRTIFSRSTMPDFPAFLSLHIWYLQCCCDLFRICLPYAYRESASPNFLSKAPPDFVEQWQCLAISYAWKMASIWDQLLSMKKTGSLILPGGLIPLSPEGCVSVHQCTKILLLARRCQLYSGIYDPFSQERVSLNDDIIESLCQSNISFLDDLASVAPIATVVQQDVKTMIETDRGQAHGLVGSLSSPPVTSDLQRDKLLSRYNLVAMGVAATGDSEPADSQPYLESSPSFVEHPETSSAQASTQVGDQFIMARDPRPGMAPLESEPLAFVPAAAPQSSINQFQPESIVPSEFVDPNWHGSASFLAAPFPGSLIPDYTVAASQSNIDGELDWFLANSILDH